MNNYRILELTNDNKQEYLNQVAELEIVVLENMQKEGKIGQLFITGKDDINEYIVSEENSVFIAVDSNNRVISAAYITQGQIPFTYNDITKYFKYGEKYNEYVKSLYSSYAEYKEDMLKAYQLKLKAYEYAKNKVLEEHSEFKSIPAFLNNELSDEENEFHEKSVLRESLNRYMSSFVSNQSMDSNNSMVLYERFFWTTAQDISKEFNKEIHIEKIDNPMILEYEELLNSERSFEHNLIIEHGRLKIHEDPEFNVQDYYKSNTANAVEIDTYITDPNQRHAGLARVLVYEGIKDHIKNYFENSSGDEIFLCSTLHRENLSSKYVSEFFGLKDNLFVKRRQGRDREVHICKIERNEVEQYLEHMQDKLAVLYGYNPEYKKISVDVQKSILEEQLDYELEEIKRLNGIKKNSEDYVGNVGTVSKSSKIERLKQRLDEIEIVKENSMTDEGER